MDPHPTSADAFGISISELLEEPALLRKGEAPEEAGPYLVERPRKADRRAILQTEQSASSESAEEVDEERLAQRSLNVMQLFASEMNRQWTAIVERNEFTKEDFEKGVEVFHDFDDAFVKGIGTDLLGALQEGEITLPEGERKSFDNAKASLDAWQRTMWSAYDALKIRGVPNVTPLSKIRGQRKYGEQYASVQNARELAEEARNQSSA